MTMTCIQKRPLPQINLDFPLMKALQMRRTRRKWNGAPLSDQHLSNLLWAACGVTQNATKRSKSKRTAPSASNSQAVKIYVAKPDGLYLYDETNHQLIQYGTKDIRNHIGTQKMMHSAPVGLIYVSDFSKLKSYLAKNEQRKWIVSASDTGFISQNVYLYCAAANLNTAVLGLVNREKLHAVMELKEQEHVIYTQVLGNARDL